MPQPTDTESNWPGQQLGLPQTGPRSIARFGRRLIAIIVDWAIATGIALLITREQDALVTLVAFAILQVVFIATLSGSPGHLLLGLRLVPFEQKWIGVLRPAVRTVLLCIVIPAFIWDRDQRGLHDKLAGTLLVRR